MCPFFIPSRHRCIRRLIGVAHHSPNRYAIPFFSSQSTTRPLPAVLAPHSRVFASVSSVCVSSVTRSIMVQTPAFTAPQPLARLSCRVKASTCVGPRRPMTVAVASGEAAIREEAKVEVVDGASVMVGNQEPVDMALSNIQCLDDVEEILALVDEFDVCDLRIEDCGVVVEVSRPGGRGFEDGKLCKREYAAGAVEEVVNVGGGKIEGNGSAVEVVSEGGDVAVGQKEAEVPEQGSEGGTEAVSESDFVVTSNRVGFFFSGAKNKPPLVMVGDKVDFNQPVCIIEQLGQQYVYLSEASGTVVEIFVEDGDAVEYGQQVMVIRPD